MRTSPTKVNVIKRPIAVSEWPSAEKKSARIRVEEPYANIRMKRVRRRICTSRRELNRVVMPSSLRTRVRSDGVAMV